MPTVAFDFFGTLFTFDAVIQQLRETFPKAMGDYRGARAFFYVWMWSSLRDYFGTSHAGPYVPLAAVLKATLPRTMVSFDCDMPQQEQVDEVMASFSRLTPESTAKQALQLLKNHGWDVWILTNGSQRAIEDLLALTGLEGFFGTNILSCDMLGVSKPHPKVYSEFMRLVVHTTQRIENCYLVASHAWDLASAKNVSIRTAFLTTEEHIYPSEMYGGVGPDVQGDTILECVRRIIELESSKKYIFTK